MHRSNAPETAVRIPAGNSDLDGDLALPAGAPGLVLFAHGSGSSRQSPRNRYVAGVLQQAGLGTLLFDLLTPAEEILDVRTAELRFDIDLLARRLIAVTDFVAQRTPPPAVGYFGASTGAAAALVAAGQRPAIVGAVVSRGGRPDLAGTALRQVRAPTLLIVGGRDTAVIALNEQAKERLTCTKLLTIVPGATHLFEEPGTLERVAELAAAWFGEHLRPRATEAGAGGSSALCTRPR